MLIRSHGHPIVALLLEVPGRYPVDSSFGSVGRGTQSWWKKALAVMQVSAGRMTHDILFLCLGHRGHAATV